MPLPAQVLSWLFYLSFVVYTLAVLYMLRLHPATSLSLLMAVLLTTLATWAVAMSFSTVAPTVQIALFMRKFLTCPPILVPVSELVEI